MSNEYKTGDWHRLAWKDKGISARAYKVVTIGVRIIGVLMGLDYLEKAFHVQEFIASHPAETFIK